MPRASAMAQHVSPSWIGTAASPAAQTGTAGTPGSSCCRSATAAAWCRYQKSKRRETPTRRPKLSSGMRSWRQEMWGGSLAAESESGRKGSSRSKSSSSS
ncbi:hypothetical protein G6O67_006011 [Ophiocordyceps sinensis]|uniref:Uncharacterized protein n=1 Tax=Ophiocordyceps sinensis TaxID=72228 RepID=A0A8H4PNR1_9HYPO|nr:hypothetical protein G6O67_006011 [Ophiocordyceps sinensis]